MGVIEFEDANKQRAIDIKSKIPNLSFENDLIREYRNIFKAVQDKQDKRDTLYKELTELDKSLGEIKSYKNLLETLLIIEYHDIEFQEIKNETNLIINNSTDGRNSNY